MNQSAPNPGSRWTKPVIRRLSAGAASEVGFNPNNVESGPQDIMYPGPAS